MRPVTPYRGYSIVDQLPHQKVRQKQGVHEARCLMAHMSGMKMVIGHHLSQSAMGSAPPRWETAASAQGIQIGKGQHGTLPGGVAISCARRSAAMPQVLKCVPRRPNRGEVVSRMAQDGGCERAVPARRWILPVERDMGTRDSPRSSPEPLDAPAHLLQYYTFRPEGALLFTSRALMAMNPIWTRTRSWH